jgi:hypothetical protein
MRKIKDEDSLENVCCIGKDVVSVQGSEDGQKLHSESERHNLLMNSKTKRILEEHFKSNEKPKKKLIMMKLRIWLNKLLSKQLSKNN